MCLYVLSYYLDFVGHIIELRPHTGKVPAYRPKVDELKPCVFGIYSPFCSVLLSEQLMLPLR